MNEFSIVPSALAYLYGDMLQDLFASSARVSLSESLPCREVKVKRNDLATLVLVTGFVYCAKQGWLRLALSTKGLLIKSRYVLASLTQRPASAMAGLEGQILSSMAGKDEGVSSIVTRVLHKDSVDPWGVVIREVQRYLLGLGYFAEVERRGLGKLLGKEWVPQCDRILPLQSQVEQVRGMLAGFRAGQDELYAQLWKDVGSGIRLRQETPDEDFA